MSVAMSESATDTNDTLHVLLVDDSPITLGLLAEVFEEAGWQVLEAEAGRAALEVVSSGVDVDVVVCDLHMPDMSGFEVTDTLGHLVPELPVVIHSTDRDVSAVLGAVRRGAFDYVPKSEGDFGPLLAAAERGARHARVVRDNARLSEDLLRKLQELDAEVSERRLAQEAMSMAYDEAVRASKSKTSFLANMSHELRTPLTAVLGYTEMLSEDVTEIGRPEMLEDLGRIRTAATHLLGLINDVLDLSKVEAGRSSFNMQETRVAPLLASVASLVGPLAAKNANEVVLDVGPATSAWLDADRLRQVLINLAGNACKFTQGGTITLWARTRGNDVVVRVADTGIGMTEEQLGRVFEAFEQATNDTRYEYGGTGLGLSISRSLCQGMGGDITARSEFGQGSTFEVVLPRSRPEGK